MNISVNWVDGMLMVGKSDSGHTITMDGPPEIGGENLGVRPMEMLILGMAGCTMIDVVTTLKKCAKILCIVKPKLMQIVLMNTQKFLPIFTFILLLKVKISIQKKLIKQSRFQLKSTAQPQLYWVKLQS